MNHIADANKMVSDTPRTTDRVVCIDGNPWVNAPFAMGLERELNAAIKRIKKQKQLIKRLKEAGDAMCSEPLEYTYEQWLKVRGSKP